MYILEKILALIFPDVCGGCDEICKENICYSCKLEFSKYKKEKIILFNDKYFDELMYLYDYKGMVRNTIIRYKFNDKSYIYKTFAKEVINCKKICEKINMCDIMLSVPIHKLRKLERGYNQSYLIAKCIGKNLNIEVKDNILIKTKNNKPQSTLKATNREENILGVYDINIKYLDKIQNKIILLLDDVYTTGSTVNECSKILKKYGAKKVIVLVIAKD